MSYFEIEQQPRLDWKDRLNTIVDMMREMSLQEDPQAMVRAYGDRMRKILPADLRISISRRGLEYPDYRITRCSLWKEDVNPWKQKDSLPVLQGGLLAELLYNDEARIIDDLQLEPDDPAQEYLDDQQSLMSVPLLDQGKALNMVILCRKNPAAFDKEQFPEMVWMSNLFGRATHNLVLAEQLRDAYNVVDLELKSVADIQRSLLPKELPNIPTMKLGVHYQTSRRAGGDYYDFFRLPDQKWGIFIADVSGHGTPAAVMMAITHSIAHMYSGPPDSPGDFLDFLNRHLAERYTADSGAFVTAFYGIYDPFRRHIRYASAGHNPPRLKHCSGGSVLPLQNTRNLPLGVFAEEEYQACTQPLRDGDQLILYTDGITEAQNPDGDLFGTDRLDDCLGRCTDTASDIIQSVLHNVDEFTQGRPATDDRTLVIAKVL